VTGHLIVRFFTKGVEMKSKASLSVIVLLVTVMLLSAIPAIGQSPTLTMTWWGGDTRHNRTIEVIEMYEEATGVDVEYEFSGWGDYWTRTTTQASGGELACLMQHEYRHLADFITRDLLQPLDPYIESGLIDTSNILESSMEGGIRDGQLYGILLGSNSQSWVLDLDAFEEAGIELPAWDWTWEDFEEITVQLHEELGIWGFGADLTQIPLWPSIMLGYGEFTYNEDGTALGYEDDQPLIDHFNMTQRLIEAGAIPTQAQQAERIDAGIETAPITVGDAAMTYLWSNAVVGLFDAAGEDRNFAMWPVPRPADGQSSNFVKPAMFFSITSQCADEAEAEEAAKFISFFLNNPEANDILAADRGVPPSSAVREHMAESLSPAQVLIFDFVARVSEDASPINPPDPPGAGDIRDNIWRPLFRDPVMYGQITIEEGVQLMRDEINLVLAENE
jgi:multiple sugar transport system substrate-binding protein